MSEKQSEPCAHEPVPDEPGCRFPISENDFDSVALSSPSNPKPLGLESADDEQ